MIIDYFFDVRLKEKYVKIAEEKFGSQFHFYSLQYKEEFEEYDKNLKTFKYLFSLGDEARIYLWNTIASAFLFDDIYKNIERNDLTNEEYCIVDCFGFQYDDDACGVQLRNKIRKKTAKTWLYYYCR